MSGKMVAALVLIALFVVLIVFNTGHASLSLPIFQSITMPKQLLLTLPFVGGLVTGILLIGK